MFLPVLLLRDFGPRAFLVFAIPNVLGAAALGWVLVTRRAAATLAQRHRLAVSAFSTVTIGFHIYWLCWVGTWLPATLGLSRPLVAACLILAIVFFLVLLTRTPRGLAAAAVGLLAFSIFVLMMLLWRQGPPLVGLTPLESDEPLVFLAPVCVFGFALCPYLDRTFLTARTDMTSTQSRAAFTLGFVLFFLAMIVLTAAYAPLLVPTLGGKALPVVATAPILGHLLFQTGFTVAAHLRCAEPRVTPDVARLAFWLLSALAGVLVTFLPPHAGMEAGEIGYRVFMGFYGSVFPAYVWLVVIPTRTCPPPPGSQQQRRIVRIYAATIGITAPMFWMGFVEHQETWLAPALAIILIARLFIPTCSSEAA